MNIDSRRVAGSDDRRALTVVNSNSCASVCNAPSTSMYLDQRGEVRACCQNIGFPLGNITQTSLRDIWMGAAARRLREAVAARDLSLGCNSCNWPEDSSLPDPTFARTFDHLQNSGVRPEWPRQLELSLSNACNLQCIMCNGEWSSSIRSHREGLPSLPTVYDENFFLQLQEFLPHVEIVKFLGGEPFLGAEPLRVMEMMIDLGFAGQVHVTTNGTQASSRIKRILERLPMHITVSLDSANKDTYESIRLGSSFDEVRANIDWFRRYTKSNGTNFGFAHCLMTSNWQGFSDFLTFAEMLAGDVTVNTVTEPHRLSLYFLDPPELEAVIDELRSSSSAASELLSGSRWKAWEEQLGRLETHLDTLGSTAAPDYLVGPRGGALGLKWFGNAASAVQALGEILRRKEFRTGLLLRISSEATVEEMSFHGAPPEDFVTLIGASILIGSPLPSTFGDPDWKATWNKDSDLHKFPIRVEAVNGSELDLEMVRAANRDDQGVLTGATAWIEMIGIGSDAHDFALAHAAAMSTVAGFALDRNGVVTEILGDATALPGSRGDDLVGTSVSGVTMAISLLFGADHGQLLELTPLGPVRRLLDNSDAPEILDVFLAVDSEETTSVFVVSSGDMGRGRAAT